MQTNKSQSAAIDRQTDITAIVAHLAIKPLPEEFVATEAGHRIWRAFKLGREYAEIDAMLKARAEE